MLIECPLCSSPVIPMDDGRCPACRKIMPEGKEAGQVDGDASVTPDTEATAAIAKGEAVVAVGTRLDGELLVAAAMFGGLLAAEGLAGRAGESTFILVFIGFLFLSVVGRLLRPPRITVHDGRFSLKFGILHWSCDASNVTALTLVGKRLRVCFADVELVLSSQSHSDLTKNHDKKGAHVELIISQFKREQIDRVRQSLGLVGDGADTQARGFEEFDHTLAALTPKAFVTPSIIAVNAVVFAIMVLGGVHALNPTGDELLGWGASFGPLSTQGQWWRHLTATFLHFGIAHLAINMWVLWDAGRLVERLVGNASFAVLYLLAGVAGSLASVTWHPVSVGAGASGSVFGVCGAILGFLVLRPRSIPVGVLKELRSSTLVFVCFNLFYGLSESGIDLAAHGGGFACGFVCGLAMAHPLVASAVAGRRARCIAVAAVGVAALVFAVVRMPPVDIEDMTTEEVSQVLKDSMEETWAKEPALAAAKITNIDLVHKGGKQYAGTVRVKDGTETIVLAVEITCDRMQIEWRVVSSEEPPPANAGRSERPLPGGRASPDELARRVAASIRNTWARMPSRAAWRVEHLKLTREGDSAYRGTLMVSRDGKHLVFRVKVQYDGKKFMWQIVE